MSADRFDERRFDEMLGRALRSSSAPAPAGFTGRMLQQIRQAEEQRILSRVVWQQRLALAACIVIAASATVVGVLFTSDIASAFRSIGASLTGQLNTLAGGIAETIGAISSDWQFYAVLAGALAFAVYAFVDLWVGDRLRTAWRSL